jgi:hypothetical protein
MNPKLAALLFVPALALHSGEPTLRTETRVENLAMGSKLWVRQLDGDLEVQGWDKPQVSIEAQFHDPSFGAKAELKVRRVADGLEIEVKRPRIFPFLVVSGHRGPECRLTLMVPRQLAMEARTVDGRIRVRDLDGYADLHSVDGGIQVEDIRGEVHAHAVDGSIQASRLQARLKGGTIDGGISLEQVAGGIELRTVDGKITASGLDGWGEGIYLSTVDGSIHLRLDAAKGQLDAHCADGRIHLANQAVQVQETRGNSLKGRIPGREQSISLRTVDGEIRID